MISKTYEKEGLISYFLVIIGISKKINTQMLTLVVGSQGMRLKKIFTYVVREYMYVYKKERKRVFV